MVSAVIFCLNIIFYTHIFNNSTAADTYMFTAIYIAT